MTNNREISTQLKFSIIRERYGLKEVVVTIERNVEVVWACGADR